MEGFALEKQGYDNGEHDERNHFLYHFELYERKRTAVVHYAESVGRHLTNVLEQGNSPREENDEHQGPMFADTRFLKFQVAVPGKGHEDVGTDKQQNGIDTLHMYIYNMYKSV